LLVGLDIFSYSPILETHNAHVRYSELMTLNMADEDEIKEFEKNMYGFYIEEDLFKMDFLNNAIDNKHGFAILMGVGWNLKFPKGFKSKGKKLHDLYKKYKDFIDIEVEPISEGCLKEFFWALQHNVPVYEIAPLVLFEGLVPAKLEKVDESSNGIWNYISKMMGVNFDEK